MFLQLGKKIAGATLACAALIVISFVGRVAFPELIGKTATAVAVYGTAAAFLALIVWLILAAFVYGARGVLGR